MGADTRTVTRLPAAALPWTAPWLSWLDAAIEREIQCLRLRYQLSLDEFRGLYVSDEQVDQLLAAREGETANDAAPIVPTGDDTPLDRIGGEFGLVAVELGALFVAFAPELDRKYDTLYAYLNDDVARRCATVDLCRRLSGARAPQLDLGAPLLTHRLLEIVRSSEAAPWRSAAVVARAPTRRFLFGDLVKPEATSGVEEANVARVADAIERGGAQCVVLADGPLDEAHDVARAIAARSRHGLVVAGNATTEAWRDALLTARLHGAFACLAIGDVGPPAAAVAAFLREAVDAGVASMLLVPSGASWRPMVAGFDYELVALRTPECADRTELWQRSLRDHGSRASSGDIETVSQLFSLHPTQIRRAARRAVRTQRNGTIDLSGLAACARTECSVALDELGVRVPAVHDWSDLVLPAATQRRLDELASAIRHREKVFRDWSFLRAAGGSPSLRVLFSGASGTGKTMSAAVVARDVGIDLFRIDLAAVVSKYIGETEKNLERIFSAAAGSNAILFFDEADALFGKRSEVNDAHDRYANIEIAYLLQRVETYDGVMILATNLAHHLDEAFGRRIHFEIEFPLPDESQRERLWHVLVPDAAPVSDDIDYRFLARQFALTGGEIRNVSLAAAFLAAHDGRDISMRHLVRAIARHRRKQGKLPTASEFKHHLADVSGKGA
jgi:hypothetical protein